MKIIGHRGAAGLAPENTLASIRAAKNAGVDAIEFDVRATRDGKIVLCHDDNLSRTHSVDMDISKVDYSQLKNVRASNGEKIPTLEEALVACGTTPAVIEAKGDNWAANLAQALSSYKNPRVFAVISFNHQELFIFGQKYPSAKLYALEHHTAMDALNAARMFGFHGIDVNFWIMNPLVYWLAKRHNLETAVYTLDWPWMASLLRILYPQLSVTTNNPERLQFLRPKPKKRRA